MAAEDLKVLQESKHLDSTSCSQTASLFLSRSLPQDFFPLTHPTDALSLFPASSKLPREEITAEHCLSKPPESDFVLNRDSKILMLSKPDLIKDRANSGRLSWWDIALFLWSSAGG